MHRSLEQAPRSDWHWWWRWVLTNAIGWALLWGVVLQLDRWAFILGGGAILGTCQWWVLRRVLPRSYLWIGATTIGWTVACLNPYARFLPYLVPVFGGQITSILQWIILLRVVTARWWVVTATLGWILAWYLIVLIGDPGTPPVQAIKPIIDDGYGIGGLIGGALYGYVTTNALDDLFHQSPNSAARSRPL